MTWVVGVNFFGGVFGLSFSGESAAEYAGNSVLYFFHENLLEKTK